MNPANAAFWLLAHITYDDKLTTIIREETAPAFKNNEIDTYYLVNSCPRLESVWHECLRLYTSVTSMRYITQNTQLDSNLLEKGRCVLFSVRQMCLQDKICGQDPLGFDSMRFYKMPDLKYSDSYRPFSGGRYICPGRHLAKHAHAALIAVLLRNYDVSLAFPQSFPRVCEDGPSIGVMESEGDLVLELREKNRHRS